MAGSAVNLTLTVIDNFNGATATATVTNTAGEVVNVYTSPFTGYPGSLPAWTLSGTRAGDGTLTLNLSPGYYWAYAMADQMELSNLVYFQVSSSAEAWATLVRRAIRARILTLGLPIADVYEQWTPDESNVTFPCVMLTVENVMETREQVMSLRTDIGRPTRVMICDRQDKYDHARLPDYEMWRQKIERSFSEQQLFVAGVQTVVCKIEYDAIVQPELPKYQFMVSEFVIRTITREPRGFGS